MSTNLEAKVLAEAKRQDRSVSYIIVRALERGLNGGAADGTPPRAAVQTSTEAASTRTSGAPHRAERQARLNKAKGMT